MSAQEEHGLRDDRMGRKKDTNDRSQKLLYLRRLSAAVFRERSRKQK